jgi:hypothetical protein
MAAHAHPAGPTPQFLPGVASIVAIGLGKGGVGKTTVSVNLAVARQTRLQSRSDRDCSSRQSGDHSGHFEVVVSMPRRRNRQLLCGLRLRSR